MEIALPADPAAPEIAEPAWEPAFSTVLPSELLGTLTGTEGETVETQEGVTHGVDGWPLAVGLPTAVPDTEPGRVPCGPELVDVVRPPRRPVAPATVPAAPPPARTFAASAAWRMRPAREAPDPRLTCGTETRAIGVCELT